ncbi:hypothetical protein M3J09_000712 [Ascochyta lentis]
MEVAPDQQESFAGARATTSSTCTSTGQRKRKKPTNSALKKSFLSAVVSSYSGSLALSHCSISEFGNIAFLTQRIAIRNKEFYAPLTRTWKTPGWV